MSKIYKLNRYVGQKDDDLKKIDATRRKKIEEVIGHPMNDDDWFKYKMMVIPKKKV